MCQNCPSSIKVMHKGYEHAKNKEIKLSWDIFEENSRGWTYVSQQMTRKITTKGKENWIYFTPELTLVHIWRWEHEL